MRSFGVTAPRLQPQPPFPGQRFGTGGSAADLFFCAAWLSSTSGSHAVATPNGRRTRPQQSRARRWRRHRRRQFSHPRIAVRIRQSPASLPAVVRTGSEVGVDEGGCSPTRARVRCACRSSRSGREQAHPRLSQSRQRRAAGVADHNAGPSRAWRSPLANVRSRAPRRREPCSSVDALLPQSQIGAAPDGALSPPAGRGRSGA